MRKRLALAVLVLALITSVFTANFAVATENTGGSCTTGTLFYIYGSTGCPYCKLLDEFLREKYPGLSVFCALDTTQTCDEAFTKQTEYLVQHFNATVQLGWFDLNRLLGSVPRTVVLKNNTYVLAIVIGAVTDEGFWNELSCLQPDVRIPVYYGNRLVGYVEVGSVDHSNLVRDWVVKTDGVGGQEPPPVQTVVLLAILAVTGVIVFTALYRFLKKG